MDYRSTLNLPKTDFPMKADLPKREPQILAQWEQAGLYQQLQDARRAGARFVLHDGPPYANGDIHIGHALNKILKDMIVRYKSSRGFAAPYVPGWDCHGMPIEHQLFKELGLTKQQIGQVEFRKKAKAYAERYVGIQREQFQRLGVMGEWDRPYLTMAPEYEQTILRVFRELVEAGYIYRGKKPVYWCATCETALAEAEVEYEDRQDASIYVKFPVVKWPSQIPEALLNAFKDRSWLAVAVWTTTPWTLPANVALAFHPEVRYVVLHQKGWEHNLIVAEALAPKLASLLQATQPIELGGAAGRDFAGMQCQAPFADRLSRVVTDEGVSMEEGTGVVHIAPGHGHEDYLIGQREKLEVLSPVDHQGTFTQDVPQFAGQSVFDANPKIIADLKRRGLLLKEEPITHSYPHCWRCKQPVIFRATAQWFLSVEHQQLRQKLLDSAKQVQWVPAAGQARMRGMLETRPDWCLSRQRYWGTPIPVLHCAACDVPLTDSATLKQIEASLTERGTDAWFAELPERLAPGARCPKCQGVALRKETDILDVWFDSGVSHEAVLKPRNLGWPASLYLEGSDQHRGWFQVSLIPSVALHGRPPYEGVLTHGFVMDGEGRKMSKSLGNVIAPADVIAKYGADILRLWVASCDYAEDVRISETILQQVADAYRKIRNTLRYLLSNLHDFSPRDAQPWERLPEIDRWALQRTQRLIDETAEAYDQYQFHRVAQAAHHFCVTELSSFYLDALKDRLYTEPAGSTQRRCAQTALYAILSSLLRAIAPILPLTAEEAWQVMRSLSLVEEPSVHLRSWQERAGASTDEALAARWETVARVREAVMKQLELARMAGTIGSPLEARVRLVVETAPLREMLGSRTAALEEAFVVSGVEVAPADGRGAGVEVAAVAEGLARVDVERAPGAKCARCWKYRVEVGQDREHPELCARCRAAVQVSRV